MNCACRLSDMDSRIQSIYNYRRNILLELVCTVVNEMDKQRHGINTKGGMMQQPDERRKAVELSEDLHIFLVAGEVDKNLCKV